MNTSEEYLVKFRTGDVIAMCRGMRESKDYSACPFLADAVQDAGYDDDTDLAILRDTNSPLWMLERFCCLIVGEKEADSVRWLDAFAESYSSKAYMKELRERHPDWFVDESGNPEPEEEDDEYGPFTYEMLMDQLRSYGQLFTNWDIPESAYGKADDLRSHFQLVTGLNNVVEFPFRCAC